MKNIQPVEEITEIKQKICQEKGLKVLYIGVIRIFDLSPLLFLASFCALLPEFPKNFNSLSCNEMIYSNFLCLSIFGFKGFSAAYGIIGIFVGLDLKSMNIDSFTIWLFSWVGTIIYTMASIILLVVFDDLAWSVFLVFIIIFDLYKKRSWLYGVSRINDGP